MSEQTVTAQPSGAAPKVASVSEAVIRIAGNSQDGIQAIGGFLARLAGRSEQEVMTFMTIPATISGGPSIFRSASAPAKSSVPVTKPMSFLPFTSILTRITSAP